MEDFLRLPPEMRDGVLAALEKADPDAISRDDRQALLNGLRHTLNWLNAFGSEEQRVPVPALSKALQRFTPTDVVDRFNWLFADGWPRLPEGENADYQKHEKAVADARKEAAQEFLDNMKIQEVLNYGSELQFLGVFSHALATAVRDEKEDNTIVNAMMDRVEKSSGLLRGYAMGRVETAGKDWIFGQIKRIKPLKNYSPAAGAALFAGLPEGLETWSAVSDQGPDLEAAYWQWAWGYAKPDMKEGATMAVEKLLDVGRANAALRVAGDPHVNIPIALLQRLLQALLSLDAKEMNGRNDAVMFEFYLKNVFNQIYASDLSVEEIAKLEWPFAQTFDRDDRGPGPVGLHKVLQKDPGFFAQLISFTYKDDEQSEEKSEGLTEEQLANRAHNAREILRSWHLMPGMNSDRSVDEAAFRSWVLAAREQCTETKHLIGCDLQLAEVFARMPADANGVWPHPSVRNLIEELRNPTIEKHIPFAIYNSRGVVSRTMDEGGAKERALSQKYNEWGDAVSEKWPRTAQVLRSLANMYDQDAKREDVSANLNDLRFG